MCELLEDPQDSVAGMALGDLPGVGGRLATRLAEKGLAVCGDVLPVPIKLLQVCVCV